MTRRRITFATVRELGLKLPGVEEEDGSPALKARGKLLAFVPSHKSAEPDSLVVRIDLDQREGLITDAPDTYYVTPHYLNYPFVLVRLQRIRLEDLKELLDASWQFINKSPRKRHARSAR
jgi:hypothetical protein